MSSTSSNPQEPLSIEEQREQVRVLQLSRALDKAAAEFKPASVLEKLLHDGADVTHDNWFALRTVVIHGLVNQLRAILDHALNTKGLTLPTNITERAAYWGRTEVIRALIEFGVDIQGNQNSAVQLAAAAGHVDLVKHLLQWGADPLMKGPYQRLAWFWSAGVVRDAVAAGSITDFSARDYTQILLLDDSDSHNEEGAAIVAVIDAWCAHRQLTAAAATQGNAGSPPPANIASRENTVQRAVHRSRL